MSNFSVRGLINSIPDDQIKEELLEKLIEFNAYLGWNYGITSRDDSRLVWEYLTSNNIPKQVIATELYLLHLLYTYTNYAEYVKGVVQQIYKKYSQFYRRQFLQHHIRNFVLPIIRVEYLGKIYEHLKQKETTDNPP